MSLLLHYLAANTPAEKICPEARVDRTLVKMQRCLMHSGCSVSCTSSASRQPGAPLLLPARSFANFRHCNLAGQSRTQHQSLDCRWQLNAAVSSRPSLAGNKPAAFQEVDLECRDISSLLCSSGYVYGSISETVTPYFTDSDSALADYGAKLKPGHRFTTRLCMV